MKLFLIFVLVTVFVFGVANAQISEKLIITAKYDPETTSITGLVSNKNQESVNNATVFITTDFGLAETRSNSSGVFVYVLPQQPLDKLTVNIKAQKEGYQTSHVNTAFFVKNKSNSTNIGTSFKVITADKIREDPIASKILQNIEQSKQQEEAHKKRLQQIREQQKFIEEQRMLTEQNLLKDLDFWFKQFDPFNPRNAFATFVSHIDSAVQEIYWAQFNFTETKTREGLAALQAVLDRGGTPQEARKAFYEKAATPREEMLELNNKLNAKYANKTKSKN